LAGCGPCAVGDAIAGHSIASDTFAADAAHAAIGSHDLERH
jgi:hypothetical protein